MTKFTAQKITDLHVPEACAGRLARRVHIVVACEASDGSWCEFDADDEAHARRLADNAVANLNARGCSCWHVRQIDGRYAPKSFYHKYWEPAHV